MEALATAAQAAQCSVTDAAAREAVATILRYIGEDPAREGLLDTPKRVAKALKEMCRGYELDAAEVLGTQFEEQSDELIVLKKIEFTSLCEHHMLPFVGRAAVGYLPGNKVVGLSKLARLVDCFAKRLQIQERMTQQIANAVMQHCEAKAAGVIIEAQHQCMACRGVEKSGAVMVTSCMLGFLREDSRARAEFMSLVND